MKTPTSLAGGRSRRRIANRFHPDDIAERSFAASRIAPGLPAHAAEKAVDRGARGSGARRRLEGSRILPDSISARRIRVALLFFSVITSVAGPPHAWAQDGLASLPNAPAVAAEPVYADTYPAREVTFSNGARGVPDVVYWAPTGYRPLTLDLYLPPDQPPAEGRPLVVHLHGGGWATGHTRHGGPFVDFPGVLAWLASWGYVVASVEYRLAGEAEFPAQIQDVKAAIRWLRQNAAKYGIDPERVVVWGESAGGHLAALAALSCESEALSPVGVRVAPGSPAIDDPESSDCVQGGVAWFGVYNLASIAEQAREAGALSRDVPDAPEWRLLRCFADQCLPGEVAAASPVAHVDPSDPPLLLIVGSEDDTVPMEQTLEMAAYLDAAGVGHELLLLSGVGHGLIGQTHETTQEANLRALMRTVDFIERITEQGPRLPR